MAIQRDFHQFQTQGYKAHVRAATSGPLPTYVKDVTGQILTASANGVIPDQDGVTLANGDSVLYWSGVGVLAPDNGIYVVTDIGSGGSQWVLTRRSDFASSSQIPSALQVSIAEGGNEGVIFNLRTPEPIVLNTTDLVFEQASGGGGAGVIELVPDGESASIPENQKMVHTGDLTIGEVNVTNVWDGTGGDDAGTPDWVASGVGSEDPAAARTGTNGWNTGSQSGDTVTKFNNGSVLDVASLTALALWVQPKLYPANANLQVYFEDAGNTLNGSILDVADYSPLAIDVWQGMGIPIEDFGLTADVQYLVFRYNDVGAQQHWIDDISLQGVTGAADLDLEGSLDQIDTDRNFTENIIPIRTRRVVPEDQQMLHSGPVRVDGVLRVDGVVTDVTPSTAQQLLATLGQVVALDEFLIGGGSPMRAVAAPEARVALDVYSQAQTDAAIAGISGGLTFSASVYAAGFNAVAGEFALIDPTATLTATLPATPTQDDEVGFISSNLTVGGGTLTVDGNGNDVYAPTNPTLPIPTPGGPFFARFKYDSANTIWYLTTDIIPIALNSQSNAIVTSNGTAQIQVQEVTDNSVVGRSAGGDATSITINTNSLLGHAAAGVTSLGVPDNALVGRTNGGDLGTIGVSANSVLGRAGAGVASISLANGGGMLGRIEGGNLQELLSYQVAHNLYETTSNFLSDSSTGVSTSWTPSGNATNWYRSQQVQWLGSINLTVRGISQSSGSTDFRPDKVIHNNTANSVLTFTHQDSGAAVGSRIQCPGNTDYRFGPGDIIQLRYSAAVGFWYLLSITRSGALPVEGRVQTTDATPTNIDVYRTLNNNRTITHKVQVQALNTSTGDSALFDISALCYRNGASVVVVKDTAFLNGPYKDAGAAAWSVALTISSQDIQVVVTGVAATTIDWRIAGTITENGLA